MPDYLAPVTAAVGDLLDLWYVVALVALVPTVWFLLFRRVQSLIRNIVGGHGVRTTTAYNGPGYTSTGNWGRG